MVVLTLPVRMASTSRREPMAAVPYRPTSLAGRRPDELTEQNREQHRPYRDDTQDDDPHRYRR
jgi:hypothetical protein